MIRIRFQRQGKKHEPSFRMVAMEARSKREGQVREFLGFYNPISKEIKIVKERVEYWLNQGAKPSDTVRYLLIKQGMIKQSGKNEKKVFQKKPGKKKSAEKTKEKVVSIIKEKQPEQTEPSEVLKKEVTVEDKRKSQKNSN
ncbi:MAG TPA: 30S ribosomal protein S16 [Candidatus Dojkabacteria bacterium]|nr:30S ribosomal protein S16 [Candidatus Dojkabacteria bacterium]